MKTGLILSLILILAAAGRLFGLDTLPGEWYGDISNVHEYMLEIFSGKWPFYFFQSPGPFYHYLIAPLAIIFKNRGYETYKYSSAFISLAGIYFIYLFARESAGKKAGLITALISSFSFWYLVWSRLGNSQIAIPGLTALSLYFMVKFMNKGKTGNLIVAMAMASGGWFLYPQTFILPPFIFLSGLICLFLKREGKGRIIQAAYLSAVFAVGLTFFILTLANQNRGMAGNFGASGYVGSKVLPVFEMKAGETARKLALNLGRTYLMLNVAGDRTFRVNVSGNPQIDFISGILFIAGLIYMAKRFRTGLILFIAAGFLVLPLPSVSPAIPEAEIPNSARTIAMIPIVHLLISLGLFWLYAAIKKLSRNTMAATAIAVLTAIVCLVNLTDYFGAYARGLPDNNLGPSKHISGYIDSEIPSDRKLHFHECCWGQAGQPEPKGIYYSLYNPGRKVYWDKLVESCREIDRPAIIVLAANGNGDDKWLNCLTAGDIHEVKDKNGFIVGRLLELE